VAADSIRAALLWRTFERAGVEFIDENGDGPGRDLSAAFNRRRNAFYLSAARNKSMESYGLSAILQNEANIMDATTSSFIV